MLTPNGSRSKRVLASSEPDHKHRSAVLRAVGKVASDAGWVRFPFYHMRNETCFISADHPFAAKTKDTLSQRAIAYILNVSERTIRRDCAANAAAETLNERESAAGNVGTI
jgi:hypothetical protein